MLLLAGKQGIGGKARYILAVILKHRLCENVTPYKNFINNIIITIFYFIIKPVRIIFIWIFKIMMISFLIE